MKCEPIYDVEVGSTPAEDDLLFGQHVSRDTKFSKGRGAFAEVLTFLSKYEPDALREPAPLFKKLDESVVVEQCERLEG